MSSKKNIKIIKIKKINNPKGNIYKIINELSFFFRGIREVYLSKIKKNQIKGWNLHKKNFCIIFINHGKIDFFFKKKYKDKYKKKRIKDSDYKLILIPPGYRFAFKGLAKNNSIINFMDKIYNSRESFKENFDK